MPRSTARKTVIWFILPALICMLLVHVIPILWGIYISFLDLNIYTLTRFSSAPFIGLQNFIEIFTTRADIGLKFLRSIWTVVIYGLITIPAGYLIGLGVALLLNQQFMGRGLVRGLILLPYITPDSVAYNVWRFIFQARVGILNRYLLDLGIIKEPLIWLVGNRALYAVIIASTWKGWPFTALILLAGLQSIPAELYEAARIDGASAWQRFRYITFPLLKPISGTLLLLSVIWNFHAFNQFYVLLGTNPGRAHVPSTYILQEAFSNFHYGQGAAMSVVLMLVIFVLTLISVRLRQRETV